MATSSPDTNPILVVVAGRPYPLRVEARDEEGVRALVDEINERFNDFQVKFSDRDTQDCLVMTLLTYADELRSEGRKAIIWLPSLTRAIDFLSCFVHYWLKAEKSFSEFKDKQETFKKQKIKESREKFQRFKDEFKQEKADELVELKAKREALREEATAMKEERSGFNAERSEIAKERKELVKEEQQLNERTKVLDQEIALAKEKQKELDSQHDRFTKELEQIAGLSQTEAKARLLEDVRNKTANEALNLKRELLEEAKTDAAKDARKVVINTIQRMCAEMTIENTVSVFALDDDKVKGQIIGREGRNIRAIEAATGAELVVDDTPETIVISSFDPIRREIARLSLKRLVSSSTSTACRTTSSATLAGCASAPATDKICSSTPSRRPTSARAWLLKWV